MKNQQKDQTLTTTVKTIILLALLFSGNAPADADQESDVVMSVAKSQQDEDAIMYGITPASFFYVGHYQGCIAVGARWPSHSRHIRNYLVCDNKVQIRNNVAPEWTANLPSEFILKSVILHACEYGKARQYDENGFLISARLLGPYNNQGNTVEIIISYQGLMTSEAIRLITNTR